MGGSFSPSKQSCVCLCIPNSLTAGRQLAQSRGAWKGPLGRSCARSPPAKWPESARDVAALGSARGRGRRKPRGPARPDPACPARPHLPAAPARRTAQAPWRAAAPPPANCSRRSVPLVPPQHSQGPRLGLAGASRSPRTRGVGYSFRAFSRKRSARSGWLLWMALRAMLKQRSASSLLDSMAEPERGTKEGEAGRAKGCASRRRVAGPPSAR